jgi:hypothetical protein
MMSVHCPRRGRKVLLGEGDIVALHNTSHGVEVEWRCFCGTTGRTVTGNRRPPR